MGIIDISEKPCVNRTAEAAGKIILSQKSIDAIKNNTVKKGNPLPVAEIAGMNAAKQTSFLIPHCHQLILNAVSLDFNVMNDGVEVNCNVRTYGRTGVEMEAINAVLIALSTIWDMVKYLEKDADGQYPYTAIEQVRVIKKEKGENR